MREYNRIYVRRALGVSCELNLRLFLAFVDVSFCFCFLYFLRSMTLVHISSRPFFASLSGKLAMASAARSTWS